MSGAMEVVLRHPSRRLILGGAIALAAGGAILWQRPAHGAAALTPDEAHARATSGDLVLVDIRRPDEWRTTGIGVGAVPLDMRREDFTGALERIAGGTDAPVALICARGVRSARMAGRLERAGFSRVADVPEGMLGSAAGPGWLASGLPVRQL